MRRVITIMFLAALLASLIPMQAVAQTGFDIKIFPSKLEISGEPGSTQQFIINVQNLSQQNQTLKIYFNDYFIKQNNEFVFKKPGSTSYSCARWLSTDEPLLEVPAVQTVQKVFTLTVPAKAEPGGHYGIIFFEQVQPKEGPPVKTVPRIGVVTLVTVPGPIVRKGIIKSVEVTSSWFWPTRKILFLPKQRIHARVTFYNAGNVHLTVKGKLTYTPSFGWSTGSVDLPEITVLPKTTRYLEADIKDPPFIGTYEATATVMYGPSLDVFDTTLTKKTTFHIYPLSLLVLLLLLLAIIFVPIWLYRRSRYEWVYPEDIEGGAEPTEPGPAPTGVEGEPDAEAPISASVAGAAAVTAAAPPAEYGVAPGQVARTAAAAATPEAPQVPGAQPAAPAQAQGQVPPEAPSTQNVQPPVPGTVPGPAPAPPVAQKPPAGPPPGKAPPPAAGPPAMPGQQQADDPAQAKGPSPGPQGGHAPGAQPAQQPPPPKAPPPERPSDAPPVKPGTDGH